jgi:hypothetical protein
LFPRLVSFHPRSRSVWTTLVRGIIIILIIDDRLNFVVASISLRCVQACSVGRRQRQIIRNRVGQIMGHHWIRITFAGLHFRDRRISCTMLLLDFEAFGATYLDQLLGSVKYCKLQTLVINFRTRESRASSIQYISSYITRQSFHLLGKEPNR